MVQANRGVEAGDSTMNEERLTALNGPRSPSPGVGLGLALGHLERTAAWAVVALAALFYLVFSTRLPVPGDWASALVNYVGIEPFRPLSHPLWGLLLRSFAAWPGLDVVLAANLAAGLFAALAAGLVYLIVVRLPFERTRSGRQREAALAATTFSRVLAGCVAALFAVFSLPGFIIGTRANPMSLDLCLLLWAVLLTLHYRDFGGSGKWYGFCLLYGVGCAEFATFIVVAPVFAVWWSWMLWKSGCFRLRPVLSGLGLFLLGSALFLWFCWEYYRSPVAEWREFESYWLVLRHGLAEQYRLVAHAVPKLGWLVVFFLMIAPAFVVFLQGFETAADLFTRVGLYFFRAILGALAVVPLFDLLGSPWRITGMNPLIVTPYFVTAMWIGHLVGYWHHAAGQFKSRSGRILLISRLLPPALVVAAAALLAGAAFKHAQMGRPALAAPVVALARDVAQGLEGRTWLLSNGVLDPVLALEARRAKVEIRLLNRMLTRTKPYLRYVATHFDDPNLQSLALAGLQPLLDVWLREDPGLAGQLAALDYPDLWSARGWTSYPSGPLFFGAPRKSVPDPAAVYRRTSSYLESQRPFFAAARPAPAMFAGPFAWCSRHLSMVANNLGVFMEDRGFTNEAWAAYENALVFRDHNLSAQLNLLALAERMGRPERADMEARIRKLTEEKQKLPPFWQITAEHGAVRDPNFYAREGLAWAASGKTDYGIEKLQQAIDLVGPTPGLQLSLARLLFSDAKGEESARLYRAVLDKEPGNVQALLGLARHEMAHNRLDEAIGFFDRAESAGLPAGSVALERGIIQAARGDFAQARGMFRAALQENDRQMPCWLGLAFTAQQLGDTNLMTEAVDRLEAEPRYVPGLLFLSELNLREGDPKAARGYLEQAVSLDPLNVTILERLVAIAFAQRDYKVAGERALDLLNVDADNSVANYIVGFVHFQEGRRDLAEAALRRSIAARPSGPALNDLAWMLQERGQYEEALELSLRATQIDPKQGLYWGTQAQIRMRTGAQDQAADCFDRALFFGVRHPGALLAAARVFIDTKQPAKVAKLIEYLDRASGRLSREQAQALETVRADYQAMAPASTDAPPAGPAS